MGIMEKNMETTILYSVTKGLYRDNGKEHGNCYIIQGSNRGLYRDNGK